MNRLKITIDEAVSEFQKMITENRYWMSKADNLEVSDELDTWRNVAETLVKHSMENSSSLELSPAPKQEGPEEAFEAKDGVPSTDRCGVSRIMNPIKRNLCWSSKRLGGVDNLTKPSDISLESVQSEDTSEKKKNVEAMFSFFSSGNEILWFR